MMGAAGRVVPVVSIVAAVAAVAVDSVDADRSVIADIVSVLPRGRSEVPMASERPTVEAEVWGSYDRADESLVGLRALGHNHSRPLVLITGFRVMTLRHLVSGKRLITRNCDPAKTRASDTIICNRAGQLPVGN